MSPLPPEPRLFGPGPTLGVAHSLAERKLPTEKHLKMWKQLRSAVDDVKEFGSGAISEVSQGVNEVRLDGTYKWQGACLGMTSDGSRVATCGGRGCCR